MKLSRISAIFRKELVDVIRDQRTMLAMVVVPLVLYPVLILGSLQAMSIQTQNLSQERITIAVASQRDGEALRKLLEEDDAIQQREAAANPGTVVNSLVASEFVVSNDVHGAVRDGEASVGLRWLGKGTETFDLRAGFELVVDDAEIRSQIAGRRVVEFLERVSRRVQGRLLDEIGQPKDLLNPIPVDRIDVADPEKLGGSILSHIVPLVLVLMTVTGAIYPAIDLTAGERERGTLETLIACPVPTEEIVIGKFLVITTLSLTAASVNLVSIGLTMQVTGVQELLTDGKVAAVPFAVLPVILLTMIPFAVLFSAVLIVVASFAKTFKEAQNYMMPVILAALIPGMAAALPGSRLEGSMLVMPVGNMVLLTREFLLGHFHDVRAIVLVLGSTCFYAATAVVVASRLFGQEAVLFADAVSYKRLFQRNLFRPQSRPTAAQGLLLATVLFPLWFYIQGGLTTSLAKDPVAALTRVQIAMVLVIAGIPVGVAWYRKIDLVQTFGLRGCSVRYFLAAGLMGCSGWVLAHELTVWQGIPAALEEQFVKLQESLNAMPIVQTLLLMAIIPGICEELLFRGFLLSSLRSGKCFTALVVVGAIFGIYHFLVVRFLVTALLGMALAYLCWQSRSLWPCVGMHMLHNGVALLASRHTHLLGPEEMEGTEHFPVSWIVVAGVLFFLGLWLCRVSARPSAAGAETAKPVGVFPVSP